VKVNVTFIVHKDDTPEYDTYKAGAWVGDAFYFYRSSGGAWAWYSDRLPK
jgi:hypothetical protein